MLLVASALSYGFASCGDDDEDEVLQPTPVEATDYSNLIPGHWESTTLVDGSSPSISFNNKGKGTIAYYDLVDDDWGIMAYGTYTLSDDKITASYTEVSVRNEDFEPFTFHGFTDGKSKTVKYTIVSCDGKKLTLKDDSGKSINYEKYADVK